MSKTRRARAELHAINGLRFLATLGMVLGRAVETMWIDNSGESTWLSLRCCGYLRRMADDFVSFYFILSGFTISWGYMTRDFDSNAVRRRYWVGRLQRFYPDYFISTSCCLLVKRPAFFGCHSLSRLDWVFNLLELALIGGWLAWLPYPNGGAVNGPSWFLLTLAMIWFLYPFLARPIREFFRGDSSTIFAIKLIGLWLISLLPWALLLFIEFIVASTGYDGGYNQLMWAFKSFPLFRLPEFIMGMALALRLTEDPEYMEIGRSGGWNRPGAWLLYGALGGLVGVVGYAVVGAATMRPDCSCIYVWDSECYSWLQQVDTRYGLLNCLIIYAVAGLDCAAAAGESRGESEENAAAAAAVESRTGPAGEMIWRGLSWGFFQEVNKWGLQVFLYQAPAQVVLQALLVDVHWGLANRCSEQPLAPSFAVFYVASQVFVTYLTAWIFHEGGPLGTPIHRWSKQVAAAAIEAWDKADADASRPASPPASAAPPSATSPSVRLV